MITYIVAISARGRAVQPGMAWSQTRSPTALTSVLVVGAPSWLGADMITYSAAISAWQYKLNHAACSKRRPTHVASSAILEQGEQPHKAGAPGCEVAKGMALNAIVPVQLDRVCSHWFTRSAVTVSVAIGSPGHL